MHSNINVHFEDVGYAVTDMNKFVKNLFQNGITKVAAASNGNFTQYEDVQDIISHLKEENSDFSMDIIPAVKCYLENPNQVINLIARNYKGYQALCKIITDSNREGTIIEDRNNASSNKPIVYIDSLQKYINKGDIVITTGGVNSVFNQLLNSEKFILQREINEAKTLLENIPFNDDLGSLDNPVHYDTVSYFIFKEIIDNYNLRSTQKRVTKGALKIAEQEYELTGDRTELTKLEKQNEEYLKFSIEKKQIQESIDKMTNAIKPYEKIYRKYLNNLDKLENLNSEENKNKAIQIYNQLTDIVGINNFYFELQNHGLEEEKTSMNELIAFAYEMQGDNANFIIGNDTRIGVTRNSPELSDELLRLQIANFQNQGKVIKEKNVEEYCIKNELELRTIIENIIDKKRFPNYQKIIENAIQNIDIVLDSCFIEKQESQNHYPQFCEDENTKLREECEKGMKWRFPNGIPDEYKERLQKELRVITNMGYSGYHLIVQDYLKYGRLLGYLDESEVEKAPLTIEELEKYLEETKNPRIGSGIGPGRGSAAGSLVCYALGITDIDPIKNGLIFERFLNEERVSMPDIDSDFRPQVRLKCRDYVKNKYGENNVCEIVTKSYIADKGCIHTVARYLASLNSKHLNIKDEKAIKQEYEKAGNLLAKQVDKEGGLDNLLKNYQPSEIEKEILDIVPITQNLFTGYSQHAAGVIISKDNISDHMPLMWNSKAKSLQTQCQMAQAEARGYLKMDFLGLRNLSIISVASKHPHKKEDVTDICQDAVKRENIILTDKEIYKKIFSKGLTQGIFQFESPGMKKMLKDFEPESFEDIVLLVAAYRPGPIDYIPEIIARKWYDKDPANYINKISKIYPPGQPDENGHRKNENLYPVPKSSITLKNDTLHNILSATYGCPIYQEQIMRIFQEMAGYSLGRADEVRRAMSKKKEEKLKKERTNFIYGNEKEIETAKKELELLKAKLPTVSGPAKIDLQKEIDSFVIPAPIEGCVKRHGITVEEANKLFDQMMPFAKYGFNKSHAAAYAVVAMETAWLKLYRTADFYCAALNNWKDRTEIPKYAAEMNEFGISLLPPTLESKDVDFTVENENIRFPLSKIKGFPNTGINIIPKEKCLFDFIGANPNVSETQLKTMVKAGCFDKCWSGSVIKTIAQSKKYENTVKIRPNCDYKNLEKHRANSSKDIMLDWISKNYNVVSKLKNVQTMLKDPNLTEKEIKKYKKDKESYTEIIIKNIITDINNNFHRRTPDEKFKSRAYEKDLMEQVFDIKDDYRQLLKYNNDKTFDVLEFAEDDMNIPCIIISCGEKTATKSGSNYFYPVTLMDRNGNYLERRFKEKPTYSYGIFRVPIDEHKFYHFISKPEKDEFNIHKDSNQKNDGIPDCSLSIIDCKTKFSVPEIEPEEYY